uniref:uncharacterized protein LOC114675497 n=1 Tax=Macaca mulatta TaxID=9544 RepID=UPI0010A22B08|nr:uncharacterized protein LOC114675497 [Macaca mulatta]
MSRAAGLSMGPRGGLSGVARTAGVPLIGVALTQTSPMTSADQMTSTLTSALATGYVNLRGEEDLYRKKRSGGEGALGLRFPLITGNSARGMAGVQPEALRGRGKAADPETTVSPGIPRTHVFEGAEKKVSEEEPRRGMRAVLPREEGMVFLVLKTLVQRRILMLLRKRPEDEISEVEVGVPHEEEGRVYFPLLTSSLALKEGGSQIPGMETESLGRVMNIFVMLPDPIIPLTMVIPQPAENAPLLSKAWTWHPYLPESAPGMMAQALLSTERWRPQEALLKTEEAKVRAGQWLWFQELQGLVEALPASAAHALAAWAVQRHMLLNVVPVPHKLSSGGLQLGPTQDSTRLQESPFA